MTYRRGDTDGFAYRRKVTIDSGLVDGDLTNFPILISDTYGYLKSYPVGKVRQPGAKDIIFTDLGGNLLSFEIEKWNSTTGELIAWVNVPLLSGGTDTKIWMYYGNTDIVTSMESTATWDDDFKRVYHMDDLTPTSVDDSTSNSSDGVKVGANNPIKTSSGKIGDAQSFNGSTSLINLTYENLGTSVSYEMWVKLGGSGSNNVITFMRNMFRITPTAVVWSPDLATFPSASQVIDSSWRHVAVTQVGTDYVIYFDGASIGSGTTNVVNTTSQSNQIGAFSSSDHFEGVMDEVRISSTARDADWVGTEFTNQDDPTTFYSVGDEQPIPSIIIEDGAG